MHAFTFAHMYTHSNTHSLGYHLRQKQKVIPPRR